MILPCNPFILYSLTVVTLSDNPFAFDTPWKYFCLQHSTAIILIVILPGSVCLDCPFSFGISWHFYKLKCSLQVVLIVMVPENTLLLYSLTVVLFVILFLVFPGISVNWNAPFKPF